MKGGLKPDRFGFDPFTNPIGNRSEGTTNLPLSSSSALVPLDRCFSIGSSTAPPRFAMVGRGGGGGWDRTVQKEGTRRTPIRIVRVGRDTPHTRDVGRAAFAMPVAKSYAFVNNRGGTGKSLCLYQLATAYAHAHPEKQVLIVDCSTQGDVSEYVLGGTQEPLKDEPKATTAGSQVMKTVPPSKTAAGLFAALLKADPSGMDISRRFSNLFHAPSLPNVKDHIIKVTDYCQKEQKMPENLWLATGGSSLAVGAVNAPTIAQEPTETTKELANLVQTKSWSQAGQLLATAMDSLPEDWVAFYDTDAEISERGASQVPLRAAKSLVLLLSENWRDYLRIYNDPVNALFPVLTYFNTKYEVAKVDMILFNRVGKLNQNPIMLHGATQGRDAELPFSPVKVVQKNMGEIVDHMYGYCWQNMDSNFRLLFKDAQNINNEGEFSHRYVCSFYHFPEVAKEISVLKGTPFVAMEAKMKYKLSDGKQEVGPVTEETLRTICDTVDSVVRRL